jgi:NADH:ubiquinone oxidoreductase subunit 6 (subunit J)
MTERYQVAIALVAIFTGAIGFLFLVDYVAEQVDNALTRRRTWREIEVRCSRERHPSFQSSIYNWENES